MAQPNYPPPSPSAAGGGYYQQQPGAYYQPPSTMTTTTAVPPSYAPSIAPNMVPEGVTEEARARIAQRAPWVADDAATQCMLCAENFGLTKRRHHCRACGILVCHDCSKETSRVVPGYEPDPVRICRSCFINHYAILIVWHSWFSYKEKLVSGEDKAKKVFDKLDSGSSRISVRMLDGCVLDSWYKNEEWQNNIVNRCQAHRRQIMSTLAAPGGPPSPSSQSPPGSGNFVPPPSAPASVVAPRGPSIITPTANTAPHSIPPQGIPSTAATTTTTGAPQQPPPATDYTTVQPPPPVGAYSQGPPPPLHTPPASVQQQQQQTPAVGPAAVQQQPSARNEPKPPSVSRTHQINSSFLNCFVAYRCTNKQTDPLLHTWISVRSEPDLPETLQIVKGIIDRAGAVQGAMVFGVDNRVHFCHDADGDQAGFSVEAQQACLAAPIICAWQVMDGSQMTRRATWKDVPSLLAHLDSRLPLVVLSIQGDVLLYRNCSVSTLDVISRTAGSAIIQGDVAVVATAVQGNADSVRLFNSVLLAHKEIANAESGLLFFCGKPGADGAAPQVNLVACHPSLNPSAVHEEFASSIQNMLTESNPNEGATPASATTTGVVAGPATTADPLAEEERREMLSCPICIEMYTVEMRKPCICGSCGNSICFGCISSLRQCPYCRHEFTSQQKAITNIALLALVEANAKASAQPKVAQVSAPVPTPDSPLD